ncbi:MAG: TetR/AcrR family transcriptional regulator [Alphaproteobacteria bacterium]|nr:TetR/AcrR family transcriptional regulator [Alphaproteobacteria bacterium]
MAAVDYAAHLERRLQELRDARKVERTRLQLEIATARLLARLTYARLTVDDITAAAGFAHGTFYRYYAGKHEIVLAVLRDFFASIRAMRPPLPGPADPYAAIHAANRHYVEVYRQNVGLMRCFLELRSEDPLVAEIGRRADDGLVARVLRSIARHDAPAARLPAAQQELLVHGVIAMVDALLRKVYGAADPPLARFARDPAAIAAVASDIWYRALYAPALSAVATPGSATAGAARAAPRRA